MSKILDVGDAELVSQALAGNRDAFGQIITRYQSLICSLAYSATGSLSHSEEVAQETFLTAWKQLASLREPHRLRSWLCGIARHRISDTFRRQAREPACGAEPLEVVQHAPASQSLPSEDVISREEEAILWRSLERIPSGYREPLILFYREHQSVEQVAEALEMSADAVKQRLARGRKLLHAEVAAFVEGALERTAPGKAFTLGVLTALPVLAASSATAATVGGVAVKTSLAAKGAAAAGLAGAIFGPFLGLLGGAFGSWCSIINTRSPRERAFMVRQVKLMSGVLLILSAALVALIFLGKGLGSRFPVAFGCVLGALALSYGVGLVAWIRWANRRQRQIILEEGTLGVSGPSLAPWPASQDRFWMVYGSLGGCALGCLSWLVYLAARTGDYVTAIACVLFGVLIVVVAGRGWMRRPEKGLRFLSGALALLGLFSATVCALRWNEEWTKAAWVQKLPFVNPPGQFLAWIILAGFMGLIVLRYYRTRSAQRNQGRKNGQTDDTP